MTIHIPVLLRPTLDFLLEPFRNISEGTYFDFVDCTLGGGGHLRAVLDAFKTEPALKGHRVLVIDRDPHAIMQAKEKWSDAIGEGRLEVHHACFSHLPILLQGRRVLGILADLGFSSDQLEDPVRGLSFLTEGPLDMRLDPTQGESCADFLEHVREEELAKIIFELGEERFSRRIARAIVKRRESSSLPQTTTALAALIVGAIPPSARYRRIHAATRTFQAFRIYINRELEELDCLLNQVLPLLQTGGRAAIISFHSLEDRMVKRFFKDPRFGFRMLTKKPIVAGVDETKKNPRARSAKLRVGEKIEI